MACQRVFRERQSHACAWSARTLQFTNATKVAEHLLYDRRVGYAVEAGIARARKAHGLVARTTFIESFLGCVPAV